MKPAFVGVLLLCLAGPALAQHPGGDEARRLFVQLCSACHGDTGKGGRGPDLTTGQWKHGGSDDDLDRSITKGIAGTEMPAFPRPPAEVRLLISFLRAAAGKVREDIPGDPEQGRRAFFGELKCG